MATLNRGVHPIIYALFDAQGQLDRRAMRRQIDICLDQGAVGITTLGLATEVRHLSAAERRQVVEWNVEDIAGRVPLGVTIFADTPAEQIELVEHAATAGANWVILQAPATARDEASLVRDFSLVLDTIPLPAALQNMPQFLGVGLSVDAITKLSANHSKLIGMKQEVSALETVALIESVGNKVQVFSGRGGLELVDCMLAGIAGHIPAPEYADYLVDLWNLMADNREDEARAVYERVLPLATFILQSLESLTTYGKLLFCLRNHIPFHQRADAMRPTAFGIKVLSTYAARLGVDTSDWSDRLPAPLRSGLMNMPTP